MCKQYWRLLCIFILHLLNLSSVEGIQVDKCLEVNEPTVCYMCDTDFDPFCGSPFQYSHYYSSKDLYLTECQGCCIKIGHPSYEGTPRRILRTCMERLPRLNYTIEENCSGARENERQICLCNKDLCNDSSRIETIHYKFTLLAVVFMVVCF